MHVLLLLVVVQMAVCHTLVCYRISVHVPSADEVVLGCCDINRGPDELDFGHISVCDLSCLVPFVSFSMVSKRNWPWCTASLSKDIKY